VTVKGVIGAEFMMLITVIEVDDEKPVRISVMCHTRDDNLELSVGHLNGLKLMRRNWAF